MIMRIITCVVLITGWAYGVFAQNKILLTEKPGTFKITTGTLNGQGPDQYMKSCGYTNTEAEATRKNLILINPDRPVYWEQVTIREVFRLLFDYWKLIPDKIAMETMMPHESGPQKATLSPPIKI